jgi:hypothetical protein
MRLAAQDFVDLADLVSSRPIVEQDFPRAVGFPSDKCVLNDEFLTLVRFSFAKLKHRRHPLVQ